MMYKIIKIINILLNINRLKIFLIIILKLWYNAYKKMRNKFFFKVFNVSTFLTFFWDMLICLFVYLTFPRF